MAKFVRIILVWKHTFIKRRIYSMVYNIAMVLTIVGGLNWGLVGITELFGSRFDLVEYIFIGLINVPVLAYIVYALVGISAVIVAVNMNK